MKTANTRHSQLPLGQLRSNAIGYLEKVLAGETIEVARRGRLVGRIVLVDADPRDVA